MAQNLVCSGRLLVLPRLIVDASVQVQVGVCEHWPGWGENDVDDALMRMRRMKSAASEARCFSCLPPPNPAAAMHQAQAQEPSVGALTVFGVRC